MKLSKDAFFCLSDEKVEELKGKQVTVQVQEPRELIKGTVTGLLYMDPIMYETYKHVGQTKYMGIIINNEIQLKFGANIEYMIVDEATAVIDRRAFFKKVATNTIPVIAGVAFCSVLFTSCNKNGGNEPSCKNCANGCDNSCYHSCTAACGAGCKTVCAAVCRTSCENSCSGTCLDRCSGSCKFSSI